MPPWSRLSRAVEHWIRGFHAASKEVVEQISISGAWKRWRRCHDREDGGRWPRALEQVLVDGGELEKIPRILRRLQTSRRQMVVSGKRVSDEKTLM
nr:hypothetical protein Iba_chr14dCG4060 [Ipomoea batatas]